MPNQMTSKERIMTALSHRQPDRVPLDIGGTSTTAIHVQIEKMLKEAFHLDNHGIEVRNTDTQGTVPEQSVMDFLGSDVCLLHSCLSPSLEGQWRRIFHQSMGHSP